MNSLRLFIIISWISLPTVMFGGYSLLRLLTAANSLTPFQLSCFRAGHAHAGVLLVMSLLYYTFLDQTSLSLLVKRTASAALVVGILAQSGGCFSSAWPSDSRIKPRSERLSRIVGVDPGASAVAVLVYS